MDSRETKRTVPVPSVGADGEQPISQATAMSIHRAASHGAAQNLVQLGLHLVRIHPVVRGAGLFAGPSVQQQIEECVPDLDERIRQQEEALEQVAQQQTL